jgi:hypothetical protein
VGLFLLAFLTPWLKHSGWPTSQLIDLEVEI